MENYNHRMDRRSKHKQYGLPGTYHVTIKVNMVYRQALGKVVGNINAVDGSPQAPHVELNEAGRMVEQELTTSITAHYPMIEIQDHVVMPDHLHCIVVAHRDIFSKNGIATHLGQVIAGFKKGCNRRFWEMLDLENLRGKPANTGDMGAERSQCPAVYPQVHKVPSRGTTGRAPLFSLGMSQEGCSAT